MSNTIPSVILTINVSSSGLKFFLCRMRHSATEVDPDACQERWSELVPVAAGSWRTTTIKLPQSNIARTPQL
jgi:hypothetical protein